MYVGRIIRHEPSIPIGDAQVEQLDEAGRMLVLLRDLGLDRCISKDENVPVKEEQPTEEIEAQKKWREGGRRRRQSSDRLMMPR